MTFEPCKYVPETFIFLVSRLIFIGYLPVESESKDSVQVLLVLLFYDAVELKLSNPNLVIHGVLFFVIYD